MCVFNHLLQACCVLDVVGVVEVQATQEVVGWQGQGQGQATPPSRAKGRLLEQRVASRGTASMGQAWSWWAQPQSGSQGWQGFDRGVLSGWMLLGGGVVWSLGACGRRGACRQDGEEVAASGHGGNGSADVPCEPWPQGQCCDVPFASDRPLPLTREEAVGGTCAWEGQPLETVLFHSNVNDIRCWVG